VAVIGTSFDFYGIFGTLRATMVIIRLQRVGRRNHAEFRIVATESTRAPKANYIELLGNYNPHTNAVSVDKDRVKDWIAKGAQVSDTVHNILVSEKVIDGKKKNVLPKKTPIVKEVEVTEEEKPADAASAEAAAPGEDKPADAASAEATAPEETPAPADDATSEEKKEA
jgi:small subunit ribosomal protein S16